MAIRDRPIAFVDIETTGLERTQYDLIEVGIVRTDRPAAPYQVKIKPTLIRTPHSRAVQVNGYNTREWEGAPAWVDVAPQVHAQLKGCAVAGHNLFRFDWPWLSHYFDNYNIAIGRDHREPEWMDRKRDWKEPAMLTDLRGPFVDTMSLAFSFLVPMGLERLSLDACCKFAGLPPEGIHRALGGAQRAHDLYRYIQTLTNESRAR